MANENNQLSLASRLVGVERFEGDLVALLIFDKMLACRLYSLLLWERTVGIRRAWVLFWSCHVCDRLGLES